MDNNIFAIHSKTLGILTFIAGISMFAGIRIMENDSQALNLIAVVMILIGAIIFAVGMFKTLHTLTKQQDSLHQNDQAIAATTLLRCMIAICIADDHLDDREISMIAKIYKLLMKSELDHETIREAAEEMQGTDTNITFEIASVNDLLYEDLRIKILKASLHILAADDDVDPREEKTLEDIRIGLGYSKGNFAKVKESFLEEKNLGPSLSD